jgi:signal transduction histidine kinase
LNKLTKLINDLLDISKMRQGKLDYREEPFDLDALSQEIVENLQAGTSTHQLLIEGRTEVQVYGDRDRIGQVLINLLTNAIKYSPKADTVIARVSKDQENAIVSVQDFGIGIAAAHHKQIFERFYQVTDPEEKTYPGLGMGLYICAEIIERHHGRIWVESRKDQGSTFSFTLPLREGKESSFH